MSSPQGSYDLQVALAGLVASGESTPVNLSGTAVVSGSPQTFTGTGTFTFGPGTSGLFDGATAVLQSEGISGTVTAAGQTIPFSTSVVNAYDPAVGAIAGQSQPQTQTQSGEYDVAQSPIVIPTTVGPAPMLLGTLNRYTDSTLSVPIGTVRLSANILAAPVDPGSIEVVQFTYDIYDANHTLVETDTYSFNLSEASAPLQFNAAVTQTASGNLTVTAR